MKIILLSIKPKFAHAILEGRKKVEYRKSIPKGMKDGIAVIYSSFPEKKIIGEFRFDSILENTPDKIWEHTKNVGGVEKEFFDEYFENKSKAFAFVVSAIQIYDNPKQLSEFNISKAPQSWMYIDKNGNL